MVGDSGRRTKEEGSGPAKGIGVGDISRDMSLRGGVRSAIGISGAGMDTIRSGASSVAEATRRSLMPGRTETFDAAMERLGVDEGKLPLIHNQIALQVYTSFLVGVAGLTLGLVFFFRGGLMAGLAAFAVGLACMAHAAQASLRAYRIRRRSLGLLNDWLAAPGEWLPSRMSGLQRMATNDPSRSPDRLAAIAARAMVQFWVASGFAIAATVAWIVGPGLAGGNVAVVFTLAAVILYCLFAANSFDVFRKRIGVECDFLLWIMTVEAWLPRILDPVDSRVATARVRKKRAGRDV